MITTRRSQSEITNERERTNVATLEREIPTSYNEYLVRDAVNEADDLKMNERARISQNLDLLMNYEKYLDQKGEVVDRVIKEEPVARVQYQQPERAQAVVEAPEKPAIADDLKPSSTTMQFTETDMDTLYQDLQKEEEKQGYYLNAKGKLMIALYALVVVAIMALIIINTSVLSALNLSMREKTENLASLKAEYQALDEKLNEISSDEHVIEIAEGEYNMVKD